MTARDRDLGRLRSSFLEVAALQLAPTSPAAAAFLQSEKTRLHLAQGLSRDNEESRLAACQRCGFSILKTLTENTGERNHITKQTSKGLTQTVLIRSCKTCGAKTRQKISSDSTRNRVGKGKNSTDTSVSVGKVAEAPSQVHMQSSITASKPAAARRPPSKKAKSLRAQLAQASSISRTNTSLSSGPGLGLMDFLKQA